MDFDFLILRAEETDWCVEYHRLMISLLPLSSYPLPVASQRPRHTQCVIQTPYFLLMPISATSSTACVAHSPVTRTSQLSGKDPEGPLKFKRLPLNTIQLEVLPLLWLSGLGGAIILFIYPFTFAFAFMQSYANVATRLIIHSFISPFTYTLHSHFSNRWLSLSLIQRPTSSLTVNQPMSFKKRL